MSKGNWWPPKVDRFITVSKPLGYGKMGLVLDAIDMRTGGAVALKIARPDVATAAKIDYRKRVARESTLLGRLLADADGRRLTHPHFPALLDVGRDEEFGFWFAMERLAGMDLGSWAIRGQVSPADSLAVCRDIAAAMDFAFRERVRIVHRDLKPRNLFRHEAPDGPVIKVIDFGIAVAPGETEPIGNPNTVTGTPGYMSWERHSGKAADHRDDIFAVGAILHELLTGNPAFVGSDKEIIAAVKSGARPQPPTLGPPEPNLENLYSKTLSRHRTDRYTTWRGLVDDLTQALAILGPAADRGDAPGPASGPPKDGP